VSLDGEALAKHSRIDTVPARPSQNYTADWIQSLTWGLSAGLNTPITFFYPAFFMTVLIHRCGRDFERCARKYGDE